MAVEVNRDYLDVLWGADMKQKMMIEDVFLGAITAITGFSIAIWLASQKKEKREVTK